MKFDFDRHPIVEMALALVVILAAYAVIMNLPERARLPVGVCALVVFAVVALCRDLNRQARKSQLKH